jgi:hypothetical protein
MKNLHYLLKPKGRGFMQTFVLASIKTKRAHCFPAAMEELANVNAKLNILMKIAANIKVLHVCCCFTEYQGCA